MKKTLMVSGLLLSSSLHADILINEVDADQTSTDSAEFVELFDGGMGNQALDGYSLVFYNGNGDASYKAISLDTYSTNANGYFVVCGDASNVANCDLDVSPDTNLIQNGADAVALYMADVSNFPNGTAVTTTDLVDALVYDTNDSDDTGLLALLNADQPQINEGENGSKDTDSIQRCSGGARDTDGMLVVAPTPGAENSCPSVQASILINEIDADQASTDVAEFIELFDGGVGGQSLDGLSLVLFNGNSDTSYKTFALDGYSTGATGYFVVCGDAANVANCDLDVSPDSNLIQNGADAVALYDSVASNFPNGTAVTTTDLLDAVVYDTNDSDDPGLLALLNADQPQINEDENGSKDTQSIQRCSGDARDTDGFVVGNLTPGADNQCDTVDPDPTIGFCGDPAMPIASIQGAITDISADASPLIGTTQIVEAIVTSDRQGGTLANGDSSFEYSGFWIQQADAEADSDPATSEGLFVYNFAIPVEAGDRVRLMGKVGEFNNVTQLSDVSELIVCSSNNSLPAATSISLPVSDLTDWEALEGMRVSASQELIVSDLFGTGYGFGNYGQFVVSSRLHFQGTEIALPGSPEALAAKPNRDLDALLVDDGVSASYPSFIPFPDETGFSASNPMRVGYTVPQLEGVIHAFRTNFMVIPDAITIDPQHARTLEPVVDAQANLVVVGMNVLNYFNGDGLGGGFPTSRGAPTQEAFDMQSAKIVAALDAIDADIIGLMEIENDGFGANSAIQTLVNELNAQQQPGMEYSIVDPGLAQIGTDQIAVGLLYRADVVTPVGAPQILDSSNSPLDNNGDVLFDDSKNRPALIQTFAFNGQEITVAVNHLKSKGSSCGEPNEGADGQGNCNIKRTRAAQALVEFLDGDQLMILGDLNAYSQEDPMQVFYGNGFTNLKYTDASTEDQPYSYSFSGLLGSLDHALATSNLADQVVSVDAWHINSVEDSLVDYLTEENGQRFRSVDNYADPDAYRSSDHDPIVVGLLMEQPNTAPEQTAAIPAVEFTRIRQSVSADIAPYFTDAEGGLLSFSAIDLPAGMSLSDDGTLTGTGTLSVLMQLPYTATVEVSDGIDSITATVEIRDETFFGRIFARFFR